MLKLIGKSLNLTLDIESFNKKQFRTNPPAIYFGGYIDFTSMANEVTQTSQK